MGVIQKGKWTQCTKFICEVESDEKTFFKGEGEDDYAKKLTMSCSKVYVCFCRGSVCNRDPGNGTCPGPGVCKPVGG